MLSEEVYLCSGFALAGTAVARREIEAAVAMQILTFFMSVAPGELLQLFQFDVIAENQIIGGQCSVVCGPLHFPLDCGRLPMV